MTDHRRDLTEASSAYILGRTDRERARLGVQASILNPLTERFLASAGISSGMRVLDVGCGVGDVALIAARLVGPEGEVVGIDLDAKTIEIAAARARDEKRSRVAFECADIASYTTRREFNAVVGRHVLVHAPDPLEMVRKVTALLDGQGMVCFEEYDLSCWPAVYPEVMLAANLQWAVAESFRRVVPCANIGIRVPRLMQQAGLTQIQTTAECLIEGGPDTLFYQWLAETTRSVLPAMEKIGLATIAGDIETLAPRLREQMISAGASLTSPLIVRTAGRKPARSNSLSNKL